MPAEEFDCRPRRKRIAWIGLLLMAASFSWLQ